MSTIETILAGREQVKGCAIVFQTFFWLNCTLTNDSPFQTFAVGLLVEFIDLLSPGTLSSSSKS